MEIKRIVESLVKKYKTTSPLELAKCKNIIVIYAPLGKLKGFYQYDRRCRYIVLNESLSTYTFKSVLSHELGHAILHPTDNTIAFKNNSYILTSKLETEADTFASELLLYDFDIADYENYTPEQIATSLQIPKHLVQLKLKSLGYF